MPTIQARQEGKQKQMPVVSDHGFWPRKTEFFSFQGNLRRFLAVFRYLESGGGIFQPTTQPGSLAKQLGLVTKAF